MIQNEDDQNISIVFCKCIINTNIIGMVGIMNQELIKLIQEYNQVMAGQSDRCEIVLSSKILSLGYRLGYSNMEEILEDYEDEV